MEEQATVRAPYEPARSRREREQTVDDDDLDDAAALELCRREQEREPVDLLT